MATGRSLAALIGSSRPSWMGSERFNEGIERACRLLPLPHSLTTEAEARFNLALGAVGFMSARGGFFVAAVRAAELYRRLGHKSRLIDALIAAALIGARRGEMQQAATAIEEAESLMKPMHRRDRPLHWPSLAQRILRILASMRGPLPVTCAKPKFIGQMETK